MFGSLKFWSAVYVGVAASRFIYVYRHSHVVYDARVVVAIARNHNLHRGEVTNSNRCIIKASLYRGIMWPVQSFIVGVYRCMEGQWPVDPWWSELEELDARLDLMSREYDERTRT